MPDYISSFVKITRVAELLARPQGATVSEILRVMGKSSRQTAYNIIDKLEYELNLPILDKDDMVHSRNDKGERIFKLQEDAIKTWKFSFIEKMFSKEDSRMLRFILESVSSTSPLLSISGDRFIEEITESSQFKGPKMNSVEERLPGFYFYSDESKRPILDTLLEASEEKLMLDIKYKGSLHTESAWRKIYPVKCFCFSGGIYLSALYEKGEVRTFVLDKIEDVKVLGKAETYPEAQSDPMVILKDPFAIVVDKEEITAILELTPFQASYEKRRAWPKDRVTFREEEGKEIMEIRTSGVYWLTKWILSLGSSVKVLGPERLKEKLKAELVNMLESLE